MHLAVARNASSALLLTLVQAGGSLRKSDAFGRSPLHHIDYTNISPGLIRTVVRCGLDVDKVDLNGKTALMYAVSQNGRRSTIVCLLQAGANPLKKSKEGKSSIDYARVGIVKVMLQSCVCMGILASPSTVPRLANQTGLQRLPLELLQRVRDFLYGYELPRPSASASTSKRTRLV